MRLQSGASERGGSGTCSQISTWCRSPSGAQRNATINIQNRRLCRDGGPATTGPGADPDAAGDLHCMLWQQVIRLATADTHLHSDKTCPAPSARPLKSQDHPLQPISRMNQWNALWLPPSIFPLCLSSSSAPAEGEHSCATTEELTTERAHSAVGKMFETLRGLSHMRDHLKQLRSVYTASDGVHQASYRPFLRQILEEVFHPDRPECPDIEHMSGGLTDLLKTGFSMFMKRRLRAGPRCLSAGPADGLRSVCDHNCLCVCWAVFSLCWNKVPLCPGVPLLRLRFGWCAFSVKRLRRKVSRPRPRDNPLLFLFLVGGVTPSELRLVKDTVAALKPGTQVLVLSTRLLRPADIPELLFSAQRLRPDVSF
ncbi:hypothetical protein CCH79_00011179 [Gambusia affinis]|uniref:Sec1 family domain-containing protein 2 n=1 Tax=Gambusia affinis TaxID=33528 RepID=A0A315USX3_GAMAF|nr:hypothetical protein CCH79_00011179 [Gambusia affinis]